MYVVCDPIIDVGTSIDEHVFVQGSCCVRNYSNIHSAVDLTIERVQRYAVYM